MPPDTCCCWKTAKSGSYACGTYTLILHTTLFLAGIVHSLSTGESVLIFCLFMVVLSGICIICSIIMLIGLMKDNRFLLLPWTVAVAMTTLIDVMVTFYLIRDAVNNPFLAVLFVTDVLICAINVYALLCVLSQYQEYKIGVIRGEVVVPAPEAAAQTAPQRPLVTTSTDEASSSQHLAPTVAKLTYSELTTISEEMHP